MTSAVALTSSVWNTMRIVGPAGAGLLITAIGIGQAFFVTAGGFALSAALIASLPLEPLERDGRDDGTALLDGLRYVFRERLFLATIGLSFFTSVFGMSYQTLLPIFAEDILSAGADGFGFLHTAAGVGALLGTLAILKVGSGRHAGPTMLVSAALFGVFLSFFSRSGDLSMALLFCAGFAASLYLNIGMVTLQVRVPDALRGRVMGIWSLTWFLGPVGGLPAGALAQWLGAPVTVMLGALSVSAFAVVLFGLSPELRRLPRADEAPA
jgi:MFS family permease